MKKPKTHKSKSGKLLGLGVGLVGSNLALASMPDVVGTAGIKSSYATGTENLAKSFPAVGSMLGAGLVIKGAGKVTKAAKKLK